MQKAALNLFSAEVDGNERSFVSATIQDIGKRQRCGVIVFQPIDVIPDETGQPIRLGKSSK